MKVKASVNESDCRKIYQGQKANIRLDAFPLKKFKAEVVKIGKISYPKENRSNIKIIDIELLMNESDIVLKPGMTVSCELITSELKDVFYIENECIHQDSTGYYLLLDKGSSPHRFNINLGAINAKYSVISGNIKKE
ncbi:MAG: HlyD family efflux transporter periplasmic adaptor subunit [Bacteroidales bacterium]|nr:HlyD family efflux transporter periplasmic adaptor subunit [Bacteroidales bacterium]